MFEIIQQLAFLTWNCWPTSHRKLRFLAYSCWSWPGQRMYEFCSYHGNNIRIFSLMFENKLPLVIQYSLKNSCLILASCNPYTVSSYQCSNLHSYVNWCFFLTSCKWILKLSRNWNSYHATSQHFQVIFVDSSWLIIYDLCVWNNSATYIFTLELLTYFSQKIMFLAYSHSSWPSQKIYDCLWLPW